MKKLCIIGRSHMTSLLKAYDGAPNEVGFDIDFINSRSYEPIWSSWSDCYNINSDFKSLLDSASKTSDAIALILQGNQHSMLSLLKSEPELDFVLNEYQELGVNENASLIPEGLIRFWYENSLRELEVILSYYSAKNFENIFVLSPPPPIYDNEVIRLRLDEYFKVRKENYMSNGGEVLINDPTQRWKSWRLQHNIYKKFADIHNVEFLDIPDEAKDENGFLVQAAWSSDATHANEWYGWLRLQQIAKKIAQL